MDKSLQKLQIKIYSMRGRLRNLAENEEDGVWRTVRGRRVFIRKGETPTEAVQRSWESGGKRLVRRPGALPNRMRPGKTSDAENQKKRKELPVYGKEMYKGLRIERELDGIGGKPHYNIVDPKGSGSRGWLGKATSLQEARKLIDSGKHGIPKL